MGKAAMRPLTLTELTVVHTLIGDVEQAITDVTRVLGDDEQAVREMRAARGWLRGLRDTAQIGGTSTVPGPGLERLAALAELKTSTDEAVHNEIDHLISTGVDCGKIGAVLGVSRQAVLQGHRRRMESLAASRISGGRLSASPIPPSPAPPPPAPRG